MIRPLDLQTLYMNLDKVGKEQAQSKEAQAQSQANQVQRLHKEHDQGAHAVGRTTPVGGPEGDTSVKVHADAGGDQPNPDQGGARRKPVADVPEEETKETSWKDPQLGKHIDISG